jgi:type VI secretion system secreted protein VgrG
VTVTVAPLDVRIESAAIPSEGCRVYRLTGREVISQLFAFNVEISSTAAVDVEALAGTDIAVVFSRDGVEVRRVHGLVAGVDDLLARFRDRRGYRLHIAPRAFRLGLVKMSEITMNTALPDLIKTKLGLVDITEVELNLHGSYAPREFTVQYEESDLDFISRLTEHLGISYFFHSNGGQDTIVFADNADGFETLPEPVRYSVYGQSRDVYELEAQARLIPSMYVVRDYNYRQPLLDLTSDHSVPRAYAGGVIEFGGHYKTPTEGKALAQVRGEERQSTQLVYQGKSNVPALAAGHRFTLEDHPTLGAIELLVVEVDHLLNPPATIEEGVGDLSQLYVNTFRAVLASQAYRPPRVTKKPQISGLVTGVIDAGVGGSPSYAQIDDQGRYMVRFFFDTAAAGGVSSRPVRMIQNHAGANYGTHFPLKPGIEVLVGFVNGDPDRPVIVGAVPNPLTPSPVDGANRTTHRIKTKEGILFDLVDD